MPVRRCSKCGSSWVSALTHCAFCGTEGELEPEISREPLKVHAAAPAPPPPTPAPAPEPEPAPVAGSDLLTKPQALPGQPTEIRPPERPAPPPAAPPESRAPLILGIMAFLAGAAVPLAVHFEGRRILGAAAFVACALLLPAGPLAWYLGQRAVDRFRSKGQLPPLGARAGRVLGMLGVFATSFELAAVAALIVIYRLSGRLPGSFLGG